VRRERERERDREKGERKRERERDSPKATKYASFIGCFICTGERELERA
jgi:hypothetical protein